MLAIALVVVLVLGAACSTPPDAAPRPPLPTRTPSQVEVQAAADYRTLACEALYARFGRADAREYRLAVRRSGYLWGVLSADSRSALTPHHNYLAATTATPAEAAALDRADPHFVAICKATGVPPS